jgi:23S rRNA U2552 (ribose-2'-O)-methylase RlmE/FtsJ
MQLGFYHMTMRIAHEVDGSSRLFRLPPGEYRVLDIGMAPGGFLNQVLDTNPAATAIGITLPATQGGHAVMLPQTRRAEVRFMDVTMLAEDLGTRIEDITQDHPDAGKFLNRQLNREERFGLVLCGGVVVRIQSRADYRQTREARRLEASQLSIGLEHLSPGGTLVMVMHKLESWRSILLLWRFSKFCDTVTVVKPRSGHTLKSSFYMVARNVQSQHVEAIRAIDDWKMAWRIATFDTEEDYAPQLASICQVSVETVLMDLGQEVLKWGEQVWKVQADALERAPFVRYGDNAHP